MRKQLFLWLMLAVVLPGCGARQPGADDPAAEPAVAPPSGSAPGPGTVASADGVEIAYTAHRVNSPTLVLVHGWMCDQGYWSEQVPALAEGFGVVTIDLAGHGASGTNRGRWTIGSLGDDVVAVVEHLGLERVIVVGHSMGGRVALDAARKRPGTVIGVIGIDTLHDAGASNDPAEIEPLLSGMEADFATTCDGFVRGMFVDGTDRGLVEPIVADMCGGPGNIGAALFRAYVAFDLRAAFTEAGVPIHVINSDLWPTAVASNREVADFRHTILSGRGHFLMQEAPGDSQPRYHRRRQRDNSPESGRAHRANVARPPGSTSPPPAPYIDLPSSPKRTSNRSGPTTSTWAAQDGWRVLSRPKDFTSITFNMAAVGPGVEARRRAAQEIVAPRVERSEGYD